MVRYQRFGRACCLHLQGEVSRASTWTYIQDSSLDQQEAGKDGSLKVKMFPWLGTQTCHEEVLGEWRSYSRPGRLTVVVRAADTHWIGIRTARRGVGWKEEADGGSKLLRKDMTCAVVASKSFNFQNVLQAGVRQIKSRQFVWDT
jgi:hypothetical protein